MKENKIVTCAICGKEFIARHNNVKYCCLTCKDAGRRVKRASWEQSHQDYGTEYMRNWRKAKNNNMV